MYSEGLIDLDLRTCLENSPEVAEEDEVVDEAIDEELDNAVRDRFRSMSDQQRQEAVTIFVGSALSQMSVGERIKIMMSAWDGLWFLLAIGVAYKVGSGTAGAD